MHYFRCIHSITPSGLIFFFFVPEVDKLWQTSYNLTGLESRQVFLPSIYSTCICVYATPNL